MPNPISRENKTNISKCEASSAQRDREREREQYCIYSIAVSDSQSLNTDSYNSIG